MSTCIRTLISGFCAVSLAAVAPAAAIYVDDDAPLGGDGQSWDTAFRYLADALHVFAGPGEVRVAQGVYRPEQHELSVGDDFSFNLTSELGLLGGYAGRGAPDPDARDPVLYETELVGRELYGPVLSALNLSDVQVDGFTVARGRNMYYGGGFEIRNPARFTVSRCMIRDNDCCNGGGVYLALGEAEFVDCTFLRNVAATGTGGEGGAAQVNLGTLRLTRCLLLENDAEFAGGAVEVERGEVVLRDCQVRGAAEPVQGGATFDLYNTDATLVLENSLLYNGNPYQHAIRLAPGSRLTVGQSTLAMAEAGFGTRSLISAEGTSNYSSRVTIANSILSGGQPELSVNQYSVVELRYTDIPGGWPGEGNIGADPLFVDPAAGDYHLSPGSPCIDAADNGSVPNGVVFDLDGKPRFIDDPLTPDTGLGEPPIVDMGCYEFQAGHLAGDMNCDGAVDFGDVHPFVLAISDPAGWQAQHPGCPLENGDINSDGAVNFGDINPFVELLSG